MIGYIVGAAFLALAAACIIWGAFAIRKLVRLNGRFKHAIVLIPLYKKYKWQWVMPILMGGCLIADIVYLYVFADRRFDSGESMRFYAGPGFSTGYVRNMDGEYGAMAAMTGCVGFEYLFNVPFSISLTLEPALGIHFHQDEYGGVGMDFHMPGLIASLFPHLGIRYRF